MGESEEAFRRDRPHSRGEQNLMIRARTWILFFVLGLNPSYTFGQQPIGAIVERFSGSVLVKQNGKQVRLRPKSDLARELRIGDSIYCEKDAKLTLRVGGKTLELDEHSGWYTVARPASAQSDRVQRALDEYGRSGGRSRGAFAILILYSPANESSVVPEQFQVRWSPLRKSCVASFVIQDSKGHELWRQRGVDGALGTLSSLAARQALAEYREKNASGVLQLTLSDTCGDEDQVSFTLLSGAEEKSRNDELAEWVGETDELMAHLGRASVFVRYEMFANAAEEYEAALKLAPNSRSLLKRTMAAERRTGNMRRAKELMAHLSKRR